MRRGITQTGRPVGTTLNSFGVLNEADVEEERLRQIEKLRKETESNKNKDWADVDDDSDADGRVNSNEQSEEEAEPDEDLNFHLDVKEDKPTTRRPAPKKQVKKVAGDKKTVDPNELAKKQELRAKIAAATKKDVKEAEESGSGEKKKKTKAEKKEARRQYER